MGRLKIFSVSAILLFFTLCSFQPVVGAEKKEPPVVVEADQMSSTEESNTVLFLGNVDAKQGDLRILSDEMRSEERR